MRISRLRADRNRAAVVEPGVGRRWGDRSAVALPHDWRRRAARFFRGGPRRGARHSRRQPTPGGSPIPCSATDAEWEDQLKGLDLRVPPSGYWRRQCHAAYQIDPIGVKLIDELGEDNMWGSDFPRPDGHWPDSQEYIRRELGHCHRPRATRRKIV